MCVSFLLSVSSLYPLVVLSNRDEYLARPSQPLHRWLATENGAPAEPSSNVASTSCSAETRQGVVLAGRDSDHGGTWFGVNPSLRRFAVVTNFREPEAASGQRSRGELVSRYLSGEAASPRAFADSVMRQGDEFKGFNLVVGAWFVNDGGVVADAWLASNRGATAATGKAEPWPMDGGEGGDAHAVSNGDPLVPWPKCRRGLRHARERLRENEANLTEAADLARALVTDVLWDSEVPDEATDGPRPSTGVPEHWEEKLRSVFVDAVVEKYGTRSSQALVVSADGNGVMVEYHWDQDGGSTPHPSARGGAWRWVEHRFDVDGNDVTTAA
ncbi:hypothetical protein PPROV_000186500 [Pycnococcus provasolii]|uniref:Uncharacterized protein n=1 Tax=Pycnococcus provasolii TaxID=41880 RepID=A0A830HB37_9CHLO|nr:hypothetical protein PPROV_000186500 [Pycnococcus provasolii]